MCAYPLKDAQMGIVILHATLNPKLVGGFKEQSKCIAKRSQIFCRLQPHVVPPTYVPVENGREEHPSRIFNHAAQTSHLPHLPQQLHNRAVVVRATHLYNGPEGST